MFEHGLIIGEATYVPLAMVVLLALASAVIGYFIGGIDTAIIISRVFYHDDIRNYGSHSAGMTNMMRTYGMTAAAGTFVGDVFKTVVAILVARVLFGNDGAYIAGCASVIGHIYPCYFGFNGGKGVAAVLAMILTTDPLCCLILFVIFVIIVVAYKYISLGSIMCMLLYPLLSNRLGERDAIPTICTFIVAALIVFRHKDNIVRLLNKTESKFTFKKSVKTQKNSDSDNKKEKDRKDK